MTDNLGWLVSGAQKQRAPPKQFNPALRREQYTNKLVKTLLTSLDATFDYLSGVSLWTSYLGIIQHRHAHLSFKTALQSERRQQGAM